MTASGTEKTSTGETAASVDRLAVVRDWLDGFAGALARRDYESAAARFQSAGYWRDFLSFTWDMETVQHRDLIAKALAKTHPGTGARNFQINGDPIIGKIGHFGPTIESFFDFETDAGLGRGYVRLLADPDRPGAFEAQTLLTTLRELRDRDDGTPRKAKRNTSVPLRGLDNWLDRRKATRAFDDRDPEVMIIGAGQAGLMLAARLGQMDVDTLVVDRMDRIGDNWRKRYHSLALHNQIYQNHLPYLPFPDTWPVYIPKDMIADWFEFYAFALELNVWTNTTFVGGDYDAVEKRWTVRLRLADGSIRIMRPQHVVMAVGVSGIPKVPELAGRDKFAGRVMHSSEFNEAVEVAGNSVLVVGAGNSAHDVAQEMVLRGASVTMLQRSSTTVVSIEPSSSRATTLYRENAGGRPIDDLDLMSASIPFDLTRQIHGPLSKAMAEDDKELLDGLRRARFQLDNGEDDTGFYMKLIRYLGGYYLNVGASDLIVDGTIAIKRAPIKCLTEREVVFEDGSRMKADIVVLATGWQPLQEAVRAMFGDEMAERVGPIWGLGSKGELRNMWTRTAQPGFFITGGTLTMGRSFSRYTTLLIKASLEGLIN